MESERSHGGRDDGGGKGRRTHLEGDTGEHDVAALQQEQKAVKTERGVIRDRELKTHRVGVAAFVDRRRSLGTTQSLHD